MNLPMFCQDGIGRPGFSARREPAANVIVTETALARGTQAFPILDR
ncbi:hypothetical protein SBI67_08090 [Mycolicibacterium sp. 120266]|nr:hypothetical protein [Mycolicibacterium sp. 120266]MDX1872076.1 hypothetical protein [Mycolicibacterium sp. 120266]